jgi:hypothetical protein
MSINTNLQQQQQRLHRLKLAGSLLAIFMCMTGSSLYAQAKLQVLKCNFMPGVGKEIRFTVHYAPQYSTWADYIAEKTKDFINAAGTYLDFPFPGATSFSVLGKKEVWFKPVAGSQRSVRIGGVHYPERVEIEYQKAPVGKPALLLHELGHYWFGYRFQHGNQELNWLTEGVVSFLPYALQCAGLLALTEQELGFLLQHWGFYSDWSVKNDYPLAVDKRFTGPKSFQDLFYIKSFHIQYLLYLELGADRYCRFLQELLKTPAAYHNNSDLLKLLHKLKEEDWSMILQGWIFPGDYMIHRPADLRVLTFRSCLEISW